VILRPFAQDQVRHVPVVADTHAVDVIEPHLPYPVPVYEEIALGIDEHYIILPFLFPPYRMDGAGGTETGNKLGNPKADKGKKGIMPPTALLLAVCGKQRPGHKQQAGQSQDFPVHTINVVKSE